MNALTPAAENAVGKLGWLHLLVCPGSIVSIGGQFALVVELRGDVAVMFRKNGQEIHAPICMLRSWARPGAVSAALQVGDRIVHQKFGAGGIVEIDGNKLTVDFDAAGQKRVVDCFVNRVAGATR